MTSGTSRGVGSLRGLPDANGYFGKFGGRFVPDTLMEPLIELERAFAAIREDAGFKQNLDRLRTGYIGRPTPLYHAANLTRMLGGAKLYLKREDLTHTGAHKINNAIGQILLAKHMGKTRVIAETGAGQHGVATAAAAAVLGFECVVYMGGSDMERQAPNVERMRLLGAEVRPVQSGSRTLKDAVSEAMRDWVTNVGNTYYLLGSALGPHPYPLIVREFQRVIGEESRAQILAAEGGLPAEVIACVGGGSNAIGMFYAFFDDPSVQLTGVEAGGAAIKSGQHAARFAGGRMGIFQGMKSYVLQDSTGQIDLTSSISAGLDYAGVGPEHANLLDTGRAKYVFTHDREALAAFDVLCRHEGIIPALESAHAVSYALQAARNYNSDQSIVVSLSGRGDKDMGIIRMRESSR